MRRPPPWLHRLLPPHVRHGLRRRGTHILHRLSPTSLSGRLLAGAALFTFVALAFALVLMWQVLARFVTGQVDQRLDNKIVTLASQLRTAPDGTIRTEGDANGPPFDRRHTRDFWWIGGPRNELRSRSLGVGEIVLPTEAEIAVLPAPPPPPPPPPGIPEDGPPRPGEKGRPQTIAMLSPSGEAMHVRIARRTIDGASVTILVAAPADSIAHPMREAMTTITLAMAGLGLALLAATFLQVRIGLRPLGRLRGEIAAVRDGRAAALSREQPDEVAPLVDELNALLAQHAANLERARRHVANLAHGLKTPLATLALTLERLPGGEGAAAHRLVDLVERRIRHHLRRARAAALEEPTRSRTMLATRLADLGAALARIYAARCVAFTLACKDDIAVACEPQDIDEIFGNLLDNAFKYTRARVVCAAREAGRQTIVEIADDGLGLDPTEIACVMQPGQRLDEDTPGHGFGLPIARELVELYGGSLELAAGEQGLLVTVRLPAAR